MRIVAFCGPKGSGKDTAAKYLLARSSIISPSLFMQVNFADTVKAICGLMFGFSQADLYDAVLKEVVYKEWPYRTPRELMQNVANTARNLYGSDIWVRAWERKVRMVKSGCIVVTDLRFPDEELPKLREFGGKIFYVDNPRIEAERERGIATGDPLWVNISESWATVLRNEADAIIPNDGCDLAKLHMEVHKAFTTHFGNWQDWDPIPSIGMSPEALKM